MILLGTMGQIAVSMQVMSTKLLFIVKFLSSKLSKFHCLSFLNPYPKSNAKNGSYTNLLFHCTATPIIVVNHREYSHVFVMNFSMSSTDSFNICRTYTILSQELY